MDFYASTYARSGFGGPLNWYRSIQNNWRVHNRLFPDAVIPRLSVPALLIAARHDPVCAPQLTDNLLQYFDTFERRILDTGHWTQLEDPEGTTELIVDWLQRHF